LTYVIIPQYVTSIGNSAFQDCRTLSSIICDPIEAPTIYNHTFFGVANDALFTVPCGSSENYEAAEFWNAFNYGICHMVGVKDIEIVKLDIYPNPATTEIHITNYGLLNGEKVEIYDMNGRMMLVENGTMFTDNLSINVSTLPQGIYFVKVGTSIAKIVKQ
jgi:hypothetical protein